MENTNWLRQTDKPLFEDVLWSRPENKRLAGKLLITGGHKQSFNVVSEAYAAALKAGIGTTRVILPQALQNMLKGVFPEAEYAPSNSIGSFSRDALAMWLEAAEWADAVLMAGDFGRNSETAILLDSFIDKCESLLGVTGDTIDYFIKNRERLLRRYNTVITTSVDKLQKLALADTTIRQQDDLAQMVNNLGTLTAKIKSSIITFHGGSIIVATNGDVSTTLSKNFAEVEAAAYAIVWILQQPEKPFEALTAAAYCCVQDQE